MVEGDPKHATFEGVNVEYFINVPLVGMKWIELPEAENDFGKFLMVRFVYRVEY